MSYRLGEVVPWAAGAPAAEHALAHLAPMDPPLPLRLGGIDFMRAYALSVHTSSGTSQRVGCG